MVIPKFKQSSIKCRSGVWITFFTALDFQHSRLLASSCLRATKCVKITKTLDGCSACLLFVILGHDELFISLALDGCNLLVQIVDLGIEPWCQLLLFEVELVDQLLTTIVEFSNLTGLWTFVSNVTVSIIRCPVKINRHFYTKLRKIETTRVHLNLVNNSNEIKRQQIIEIIINKKNGGTKNYQLLKQSIRSSLISVFTVIILIIDSHHLNYPDDSQTHSAIYQHQLCYCWHCSFQSSAILSSYIIYTLAHILALWR